uniref:Uncharacterized protein n=1 Tax=Anopheles culicifacies TaxID=139723 RepID=A0A182MKD2_9DIPT
PPKPVVQPPTQQQQQQQQQVAQESIAGKSNALLDTKQPVKALRKKRHISPQSRPRQQTTNAASNDQVPGKASTPSSTSSSSASSASSSLVPSASRNDRPAYEKASLTAATSVSSSMAKTNASPPSNTCPPALDDANGAPILTPIRTPDKTLPSVQQTLNTPADQTKQNQPVEGVRVGSPPVPPRRKRESRPSKLGKI